MDNEMKRQIIKSTAAVICAASVCIAATSSTGKIADAIKNSAANSGAVDSASLADDSLNDGSLGDSFAVNEDNTADLGSDEQQSVADGQNSDGAVGEDNGSASAADTSTDKDTGGSAVAATTKPASKTMSKAEIINYCNTALNKAKTAKVGYNKKMVREVKGSTDGISQTLINLVAANKSSTMKKGSSDIKDDFPAAGYDWSSKLRESDVATATMKTSGQYYEIKLTLGNEKNPGKGETSSYGRVMSVIDAAGAGDMVPGIKSIDMSYHDGYVYAKIDSKTGKLVAAEFSASADIQASIAIFGDISVKDIVSTETFTNIVW